MDVVFDIYPAADPLGTKLVRLTNQHVLPGSGYRHELRGASSGQIVINTLTTEATETNLAQGNFVVVLDLDVSTSVPLGAFFLEEGDFAALSVKEGGGRDLALSGRGAIAILERGMLLDDIHDPTQTARGDFDVDGQWTWVDEPYGAMLVRAVTEGQEQPGTPLADVTLDFTRTLDSDGGAWPEIDNEYRTPIGTDVLTLAGQFVRLGLIIQMDGGLILHGYQTFGTDRSSATFAADKVRFEAGVNIAADLRRAVRPRVDASHVLVEGQEHAYRQVIGTSQTPAIPAPPYKRWVYLNADETDDADTLDEKGEQNLRARRRQTDTAQFPHPPGDDEANGYYTPGPAGTDGHYWVGDIATVHTGSAEWDFNEEALEVAAINWVLRAGGDWDPIVELGGQYVPADQARFEESVTTVIRQSDSHTHPPNPELCRAAIAGGTQSITVLFDSTLAGENGLTPDWTPGTVANVGESFYRRNLGDATSYNTDGQAPENFAASSGPAVQAASGMTCPNFTGDAVYWPPASGGTTNARTRAWGLLETYSGLVHLMDAGDGAIGETDWQLRVVGTVRHPRGALAASPCDGDYPAVDVELKFFSNTNAGTQVGSTTVLAAAVTRGTSAVSFDETINIDSTAQSFGIISDAVSGTGHWVIWEALRIELLRPLVGGGTADPNDGHPDLVGTGSRASRCDHRHDIHSESAPTVNDDETDGYHVGTTWAQLDSLTTPTSIDGVWICADASEGAAVWLALPGAHDEDHATRHEDGGADEILAEDLATAGLASDYLRGAGSGALEMQKNNFAGTAAPTANEDSGDGYSVGSRWIDTTNDKEYICLDATATAAVWTETTQSGGGHTHQWNEVPAGAVNGTNDTFALAFTPDPAGSLLLFVDGVLQAAGGEDYTLTDNSIVFDTAPTNGAILLASYVGDQSATQAFDLSPDFDTYMNSQATTTNYDTATELWVGDIDATFGRTAVLEFDISGLIGETISSAELRLFRVNTGTAVAKAGLVLQVRECLRDFVSSEVTWNQYSSGNNWASGGGLSDTDRSSTVHGSATFESDPQTDYDISITSLVSTRVGASATVLRLFLQFDEQPEAQNPVHFASQDNATVANRPILHVEVT